MRLLKSSVAIVAFSLCIVGPAVAQADAQAAQGGTRPLNPVLGAQLQPLLPAGMTLETASRGFRSETHFIATLHAAVNLGIPFERLKAEVTGAANRNLGQAIRNLKPTADAPAEVDKAQRQAKVDMEASGLSTLAKRIEANPTLSERLRPLLPPTMTFDTAAAGFSSEGHFAAALHACRNLNIPFDQLKARLVTSRDPLWEAIHALNPTVDARAEAQKAEGQARADMQTETYAERGHDWVN